MQSVALAMGLTDLGLLLSASTILLAIFLTLQWLCQIHPESLYFDNLSSVEKKQTSKY